ncbi:MAG: sulfite exporter TauE/SafE family protein [Clostridia bacterium]|nr:sulfite exporter TauE/SafE family protein [Clostridia bacterium]
MKEKIWYIGGMYCPHCESAVVQAVNGLDGIADPRADYRTGTLTAVWDEDRLPEALLADCIAQAGYELKTGNNSVFRQMISLSVTLLSLAALYLLFGLLHLDSLFAVFPTARAGMRLSVVFVLGMFTSLHCVAMCGGINLVQSAASVQAGRKPVIANIQYNAGRLFSYTLIGGIVGALGTVLQISTMMQAFIQSAAAIIMVIMALNMLDLSALKGILPGHPGRRMPGSASSFWIGLLNGIMPCGPLQAMQIYALSTGRWYMGALSMACFALGTIPLMLGFGLVSGQMNKRFAKPMRILSGVLVLIMGMAMLNRGLSLFGIQGIPVQVMTDDALHIKNEVQVIRSELDWRSYPDIRVKAGIPVKWIIHADEGKITGCNNEMVIPSLKLRVSLQEGEKVVEFTADTAEVISYTCWMGMLHGTITVEQ